MRATVRWCADRLVGVGRCPTRRPEGPGMGVRRGRMPTVPSDLAVRMIAAQVAAPVGWSGDAAHRPGTGCAVHPL